MEGICEGVRNVVFNHACLKREVRLVMQKETIRTLDLLTELSKKDNDGGDLSTINKTSQTYSILVNGKNYFLCIHGYINLFGLTYKRVQTIKKSLEKDGVGPVIHGNKNTAHRANYESSMICKESVKEFMENLAKSCKFLQNLANYPYRIL